MLRLTSLVEGERERRRRKEYSLKRIVWIVFLGGDVRLCTSMDEYTIDYTVDCIMSLDDD